MKQVSLVVLAAVVAITTTAAPHEDSYYKKFGADHTMVKYKPNTPENPVANCGIDAANGITIAKAGPLSAAEQQAFVDAHNNYRRQVAKGSVAGQPAAANMEEVKWDDELAAVAQRWAEQCPDGSTRLRAHDKNRDVDAFSYVGQNAFWDLSQSVKPWYPPPGYDAPAQKAAKKWFDEVANFDPALIDNFQSRSGPVIGHYTQVVWAKSARIGCGFFMRKEAKTFGGRFPGFEWQRWLVCNYGPGGNILGRSIYKKGTAGSACPIGKSDNNGLCA